MVGKGGRGRVNFRSSQGPVQIKGIRIKCHQPEFSLQEWRTGHHSREAKAWSWTVRGLLPTMLLLMQAGHLQEHRAHPYHILVAPQSSRATVQPKCPMERRNSSPAWERGKGLVPGTWDRSLKDLFLGICAHKGRADICDVPVSMVATPS